MTEAPTCATCRFFEPPIVEIPEGQGQCRRHPKSMYSGFGWPMVDQDDWCGEHQPRDDASTPPAGEEA